MTDRSAVPEQFQSNDKATGRQVSFIADLLDRKNLFACSKWFDAVNAMDSGEYAAHIARVKEQVKTVSKKRASEIIDTLLALPDDKTDNRATATAGKEHASVEVPDGHYALTADDALNPVRFYHVNKGKDYSARGGRDWSTFTFVDRYAGDDKFPVKGAERASVLQRIAADPLAAAQLYGRESERCCICNRNLTRKLSRELGIGPVCGKRHEWLSDTLVAEARDRIVARGEDPDEEVS